MLRSGTKMVKIHHWIPFVLILLADMNINSNSGPVALHVCSGHMIG